MKNGSMSASGYEINHSVVFLCGTLVWAFCWSSYMWGNIGEEICGNMLRGKIDIL